MDPVIRIVSVTTLLLTGYLLAVSSRNWRWTLCVVLLAMSLAGFVVDNGASEILRPTGLFADAATILAKLTVAVLWLFLLATFEENFRFRPVYVIITVIWGVLALADFPYRGPESASQFLDYITLGLGFALIVHAIWQMLNGFSGDLRKAGRQLRFWVGLMLALSLIVDLSVDLILGTQWRPPAFLMTQNVTIGVAAIILAHLLLRADLSDWVLSGPGQLDKVKNQAAERLVRIMREERLYLLPDLTFSDYANKTPYNAAETRRLINHDLGFGHFKSFVNYFRIEHAKTLLHDVDCANEKIIGIAIDSGFASLPSFQRVFKTTVGMTPTAWKKQKNFDA